MKITLLNSSILTTFGEYEFLPLTLSEARSLVRENAYQSAIGHQSTAEILSELLELKVEANRIEFQQTPEDVAIIFKLRSRPPEGKILTEEELNEIGYDFGILRRLK